VLFCCENRKEEETRETRGVPGGERPRLLMASHIHALHTLNANTYIVACNQRFTIDESSYVHAERPLSYLRTLDKLAALDTSFLSYDHAFDIAVKCEWSPVMSPICCNVSMRWEVSCFMVSTIVFSCLDTVTWIIHSMQKFYR
jgi:hypothetical protein